MEDKKAFTLIGLASAGLLGFIFWLTYFHEHAAVPPAWASSLAHLNAFCNFSSACCLLAGYRHIRAGRKEAHKRMMLAAVALTTGFLLSYTLQHHFVGDTKFGGEGALKTVYLIILISHILLSMVITPLVMTLLFFALTSRFEKHKKLARITFPAWLYVSITGVLVYLFLTQYR
jgi:putative membrane protein